MNKKIGIIDLGSNSVRLVIFEVKRNGAFRLIDDISDTIRLSENMIDGKYINDFAMRKALKTVKLFKKLCMAYKITSKDLIAVATEAVRKAENREQFLSQLYTASGIKFRVLSGEEEALYIYKAVIHTLDVNEGIIVDIGGGSTEIIKFKNNSVVNNICIPIGSVTATEAYLSKDYISPEGLSLLEEKVHSMLSSLQWLSQDLNQPIIGLGGTIRNVAKIHRKRTDYPLSRTHNYTFSIHDFLNIYDHLKDTRLENRKKIEGISPVRADIIVGGLTILKILVSYTASTYITISGYGLREGILFEYIFSSKSSIRFTNALSFSLDNYIDLYGIRRDHANHVCELSLSMFDQLQFLHNMGEDERKILTVASILHDIGVSISYYEHYRHSFYILLNSRLDGLTHREIVLVAATAASHGKNQLDEDWYQRYGQVLVSGDYDLYSKLSIFLRIAECLDRSETGTVKALECQVSDDTVKMKTFRSGDAELELNLANENTEGFRKLFNKLLVIS